MTGSLLGKSKSKGKTCEEEIVMAEAGSLTSDSDQPASDATPPSRPHNVSEKLYRLMHGNRFQITIVSLVIVNSLVVMVELLLELGLLEESPSDNTAAKVLCWANRGLLSLFVAEYVVKAGVFRRRLLSHRMELLDAGLVAIAAALALAMGLQGKATHPLGLVIVGRLWRVTKLLNALVAGVRAEAERRLGKERRARRALEREVAKLREYCLQQECELQVMRYMLRQNGISEPTVLRPPPAVRTLSVIAEVAKEQEASSTSDSSDQEPSTAPLLQPAGKTDDDPPPAYPHDEESPPPLV